MPYCWNFEYVEDIAVNNGNRWEVVQGPVTIVTHLGLE